MAPNTRFLTVPRHEAVTFKKSLRASEQDRTSPDDASAGRRVRLRLIQPSSSSSTRLGRRPTRRARTAKAPEASASSPRSRSANGGRSPSGRRSGAIGSLRLASSTDPSMARAFAPMSSRFSSPPSIAATRSSWTTSEAIRPRRPPRDPRRRGQALLPARLLDRPQPYRTGLPQNEDTSLRKADARTVDDT
jgi:hypothetical protein